MKRVVKTYGADAAYGLPTISFKALPDEGRETGRFEAIVSVFGNTDLQGDRVIQGAFRKSLDKWRALGDPIPIIWSHNWGDPFAHIGAADPRFAEETDHGLKVIGRLDVEKPFAAQVYDLLKARRVREWSFAYDIHEERPSKDDSRTTDLLELDLIEAGPTLKGANPDTETLGVKSALEHASKFGPPRRTRATSKDTELLLRLADVTRESLADFRKRMLREFGDTDDIREALGLPTRAQLAEEERKAKAAVNLAVRTRNLGEPSEVRVDPMMRPVR